MNGGHQTLGKVQYVKQNKKKNVSSSRKSNKERQSGAGCDYVDFVKNFHQGKHSAESIKLI